MTQIALFVLAKLGLLLSLTVAADWAGMGKWFNSDGIDLGNVFLFAAAFLLFGMILPAAFSKWVTKRAMLSRSIITPANASEAWLISTIQRQAGLDKDNALIAVSSGLLEKMERTEAEAVLEKKVKHVARGDMLIPVFFGLLACWMLIRIQHGL